MFYGYSSNNFDYNECNARGACSVSPYIVSLQIIMLSILSQIAYYISNFKGFDNCDQKLILFIIEQISNLDSVKEFSEAQIIDIINLQYNSLKNIYNDCTCEDKIVKPPKLLFDLSSDMKLSSIIKNYEHKYFNKYSNDSTKNKYVNEILIAILKSISNNIIAYNDLQTLHKPSAQEVISALNLFNKTKISIKKIKESIKNLSLLNIELLELIYEEKIKKFGDISETITSFSTTKGKAILVSGSDLNELYNLLEKTKDKNFDIYTNGNLIISHAFAKFKNFKNLKGHFGNQKKSTILDFATFPGPVLLTKNETKNLEYLYRGKLFTSDSMAPKGIVHLESSDYNDLIEAAELSKGFKKGQERKSVNVGFDIDQISKEFKDMSIALKNKSIKQIFIIGLGDYSIQQDDYFTRFFKLIPKDSYVLSFSYGKNSENIRVLNIGNDYSIALAILHELFKNIPLKSDNLVFYLTKCDVNTLSSIVNLKNNGAKHVFLSECPSMVINPTVLKEFSEIFDIKITSNPKKDLELIF